MKPETGTVLDGYKLLAEIGSGSCGTVFQAENIISKRIFALKISPEQGSLAERELQAVRLFLKIEHPNLIRIHHVGQTEGILFYTMDWCECSLAQRKVTPEELLGIARKLAGALAELHKHGLIHRDIKPDNIFFRNGEIVLGDIGLVTRSESATFAGSPGFLAPALLDGKNKPNPYTDCYALAKSLYCALSGQEPGKFPFYDGPLGEAASVVMRATLEVCSDEPEIHNAAELLDFLNDSGSIPVRRKKNKLQRIVILAIPLLLFSAAAAAFLWNRSPRKKPLPTVRRVHERPQETVEIMLMRQEIERLGKAAGRCSDPEEKFDIERRICFAELLVDLVKRRNSGALSERQFKQEQRKLVDISNYVEELQKSGVSAENRLIPPILLEKSDPELKERWKQVNTKWGAHKRNCILAILRKIRETGKMPKEILKKMAVSDRMLHFFGIDQTELLERYRDADPGNDKETVLTEYLARRDEFLRSLKPE